MPVKISQKMIEIIIIPSPLSIDQFLRLARVHGHTHNSSFSNDYCILINIQITETRLNKGIIEGDQIEVAAFSFESFAYLTGLVIANNNAGSNSVRSHIAKRQEPCFLQPAL